MSVALQKWIELEYDLIFLNDNNINSNNKNFMLASFGHNRNNLAYSK
jgi:hypothetical protein